MSEVPVAPDARTRKNFSSFSYGIRVAMMNAFFASAVVHADYVDSGNAFGKNGT